MVSLRLLAAICSFLALPSATAFAIPVVPGSANPNLAGRDAGYGCCSGDLAPAQSPSEVGDVDIESCATLHFSVTGRVSYTPSVPVGDNPDGDEVFDMVNFGDGISAPTQVRANALVGVFLDDSDPTGQTTPPSLDFSNDLGFTTLAPKRGQIFFIGDGKTSDSSSGASNGGAQGFVVPSDATRLFLGSADGYGWLNNTGSFQVTTTSEPELRDRPCGDPKSPNGLTASDSLLVLQRAVGTALCRDCICDVDRSGAVVASDGLAVLRKAVGQDVKILCGCCPALD